MPLCRFCRRSWPRQRNSWPSLRKRSHHCSPTLPLPLPTATYPCTPGHSTSLIPQVGSLVVWVAARHPRLRHAAALDFGASAGGRLVALDGVADSYGVDWHPVSCGVKIGPWLSGWSSSLIDCRSRVQFPSDAKKGPLIARVQKSCGGRASYRSFGFHTNLRVMEKVASILLQPQEMSLHQLVARGIIWVTAGLKSGPTEKKK